MVAKKVLLISSVTTDTQRIPETSTVEVSTVPKLPEAVQEMAQSRYDAVVLTESEAERHLPWFKAELDRMVDAPMILCLVSEQTEALRDSLSLHGIPYQGILDVSPHSLVSCLGNLRANPSPNETADRAAGLNWDRMLIGESPAMQRVREVVRLVARRSCTILITGESGTGKEVVAQALHLASDRAERAMVSVNCAAVPTTLLESEMFGYEKGAFTGAATRRVGRFEQAHRSTILLDEIGDMPLELQAKILRVLQEREIQKIGNSSSVRVDVRVVASTNRDLNEEVSAGRFRHDLYFRLRVIPLHMPPLRERTSDIPPLADHFLEKICRRERIAGKRIGPGVIAHFTEQSWPGNVRELEHAIERAIALSGDREILDLCDFPPFCDVVPVRARSEPAIDVPGDSIDFERVMARLEKALIDHALQKSRGNKARAAQMLGLKRSTLVSKVKAFQMCAC